MRRRPVDHSQPDSAHTDPWVPAPIISRPAHRQQLLFYCDSTLASDATTLGLQQQHHHHFLGTTLDGQQQQQQKHLLLLHHLYTTSSIDMDTNSLSQSLDSVNTAVSVAGEEEVSCGVAQHVASSSEAYFLSVQKTGKLF